MLYIVNARRQVNEAVVFSQPLDLLVVIILHHCFQTDVISGSGLKVGVVSQKNSCREKRTPPFQNPRSAPAVLSQLSVNPGLGLSLPPDSWVEEPGGPRGPWPPPDFKNLCFCPPPRFQNLCFWPPPQISKFILLTPPDFHTRC